MPNIQPFEKYYDKYDNWFEKNLDIYHAELETLRQLIPLPPARGLEVGVGSGRFASSLGIGTGVEPSENMASKAEKRGINVFHNVAEDLPFNDSMFDFVLMVTTLCFVDDIHQSLKEARRVISPVGCIIVGFIDKDSELGQQYMAKRNTNVFYKDANFISTLQLSEYLKNAGFEKLIFKQTLIPEEPKEIILNGYGRGAFVAVKAVNCG